MAWMLVCRGLPGRDPSGWVISWHQERGWHASCRVNTAASSSYNPFDGPNENPEAELPLTAGKYLYVYGDMDEDGFYEGL